MGVLQRMQGRRVVEQIWSKVGDEARELVLLDELAVHGVVEDEDPSVGLQSELDTAPMDVSRRVHAALAADAQMESEDAAIVHVDHEVLAAGLDRRDGALGESFALEGSEARCGQALPGEDRPHATRELEDGVAFGHLRSLRAAAVPPRR